jgi:endonuclease YncB( thermonuclease family)
MILENPESIVHLKTSSELTCLRHNQGLWGKNSDLVKVVRFVWRLTAASLLGLWLGSVHAQDTASKGVNGEQVWTGWVSWVADGDTLLVLPEQAHEAVKLRIDGIDAPERCQSGGDASRDAMIDLVHRKTILVFPRGTDSYGRVLGRVEMDGRDVAAQMVAAGMAWAFRFRETSGPYAALERQARKQKKGLFAEPQPLPPRVFRQFYGSCHGPQ